MITWLKSWAIKFFSKKFIQDKVGHGLTLISGLLVEHSWATAQEAETLVGAAAPILVNLAMALIGVGLSINATKKAAE